LTRILILGSYSPSLRNFRGALIEALVERGIDVHVAAPLLSEDVTTGKWLDRLGVVRHDIALSRAGLNPIYDLSTLWQLSRLMRQINPDVFLGYTVKPVVWGLLAARLAKVPKRVALITGLGYAFTGAATGLRGIVRYFARKLYGTSLRHASLVFFQNFDDQCEFYQLGLLPPQTPTCVVAGSGVDIAHFSPAPFPNTHIKFLLIARLLGDKGIREYAAAAEQLKNQGYTANFQLVGPLDSNPDGLTEETIKGWCEMGALQWSGGVDDVRPAIADAHVYVLPSYREGTPRTVLEAMAMGRPIITTDAPGCRESVEPERNGVLVPIKDSHALATAMRRFIDTPDLVNKMGAESRQIAEDKYDVHKVNASMLEAMGI